jgi:PAS domain S-box-containing protein
MLPTSPPPDRARRQACDPAIRCEQIRLLYKNTTLSVCVTIAVASVLSYLQWSVIPHQIVLGWLTYMVFISLARFGLWRFYRNFKNWQTIRAWGIQFFGGAALAAAGWGAAGIVLYPQDQLTNQVFLAFVLGGMMVGAASVLAARLADFVVFIALTGLPACLRLLFQADDVHLAMGLLAMLYTAATLITAWQVHRTIVSSLKLRFENQDLLANLRSSNEHGEVLNDKLRTEAAERKQASEAVEKSERRLELALFGADLGLWDWNLQTGEVFWDRQWAAMLGYELEDLKPALPTWEQLVHPEDRAEMRRALQEHLDGRRPFYESEHRIHTRSGEWKWILSRGKIVARDPDGRPIRITGTHRDVTEHRRTEDALRQSHEVLESRVQERTAKLRDAVALLREEVAERKRSEQERARIETHLQNAQKLEAIGILARGIAHDFNNILTAIIGFTRLAKDDLPPDLPVQDHLEQVVKAGERAADLVRRLLVFSRKGDESAKPVEIGPVVVETLQLLRASIPSSIDFRQEIDPNCGYVLADPTLIHQVVMNLCTNAYQAMQGSVGCLEVTLSPIEVDPRRSGARVGLPRGAYVELTVSDTGPGIPPQIADRVFEPFFTTKDVGQGTGLGLAVVHGVVSRCGGAATFESVPGRGTSFYIYLPRVPADRPPTAEAPGLSPRGAELVLFVDDEEDIAKLGSRMLEDLGYRVTAKTSSLAALQLFTEGPHAFDLVISDFAMPKMTGGELISALREIRPDIPAILISGFHDELLSPEQAMRMELVEQVKKPFLRSDLALAIRRALDRRQASRT